jgi:predicted MFS family arabinose efflux permease
MIQKAFRNYISNFQGFSREIWILTIITFINRAGTMVLPFLSKYLYEDLHFDEWQIGNILVCFGCGSMLGSWLGGKLSDTIGFYKIMIFSLLVSGLMFFGLRYVTSYYGLCLSIFILMTIADMFRPAMFVSIGAYAKPENRTRALTLVRLAINLGFAAGPALGGLIIMYIGYKGLFWVDGITCVLAILIFWIKVKEKKNSTYLDKEHPGKVLTESVFKDKIYWLFLVSTLIVGIMFFQLFTTIPIYHRQQFGLTELQTGLLLTLNGVLVFFLEMPIVNYVEKNKKNKLKIIILGCFLMTISLFLMLVNTWAGVLIIMMLFMTFAEMFNFPFSNSFALSRAPKHQQGRYMAIFTMTYSLAHILSAKIGMTIIANKKLGYQGNWLFMGILGIVGTLIGIWAYRLLKKEKQNVKNS